MSDKKLELIIQMLNKAESTTPEEAEALSEHAERLMLKYGFEQAVINERRSKGTVGDQIITDTITFSGAFRLEHLHIGHMVANGMGNIRCMMSRYKNRTATLHLVGYASDVAQAKLLIASLQIQATVAVKAWWKINKSDFSHETSYDQEAARRSFVNGFGTGAGARIASSRQQAVQEAGTGTELVLVSRAAKVDEHFGTLNVGPSTSRTSKGSTSAAGHGYRAGQNANTGEKAVGHTKQVTA